MKVRKFNNGDEDELWDLFFNTIHKVNSQNYTPLQVAVWAPKDVDRDEYVKKFREINPFIALKSGKIVGYADIQSDGYIDHFYCHHQFQRQGVGSLLFAQLEKTANENNTPKMYSNVSITAKPFFESKGFSVEKEQQIQLMDQQLKNFRMVRENK